ncbi:PadR family transcriptional regulator [Draconibacterium sediminis]|uniref:PadR family transcriptional regulator n=1 Tax=Draconibacterium sediminis TaxID=1544798 RepID=UPI0026F2F88C|nr:helix-turn-helix transcriptional regulator [Draconibacterium sediminis]
MTKQISKSLKGAVSDMLILGILSQNGSSYGYEINKIIMDISNGKVKMDAGNLYPLLNKMEEQELIKSEWKVADNSRPRRYYHLLEKGRQESKELREEWDDFIFTMDKLLAKSGLDPIA